jgi:hypothetical protein
MHTITTTRTPALTRNLAGLWLVEKLRQQARTNGTQAAARYARKTLGLPLELALSILAR